MSQLITSIIIITTSLSTLVSSKHFKVGVLYGSKDKDYTQTVRRISEFAISQLDNSSSVTLELIIEEYEPTLLKTAAAVCSLLRQGVILVITSGDSDRVAMELDILSAYKIPVISTSATDSLLKGAYKRSLLLMSPTNFYQVQAIYNLLKHYNWYDFSILASSDNYGVHGVTDLVYLTRIITKDSNYRILNVQYINDDKETTIRKKLNIIKDSLSRVVILNCPRDFARNVLKFANDMGMLDYGYVWILSDATMRHPVSLSYNGGYPSYYEGLLAVLPANIKQKEYRAFKDKYILERGGKLDDITIYTILAYDAIGLIHDTLRGIVEQNKTLKSPEGFDCSIPKTWDYGEMVYESLINTTKIGASGLIKFSPNGYSKRRDIDILNFRDDRFVKVGMWNRTEERLTVDKSSIRYLGGKTDTPSAYANTLSGRTLRIGILNEPPLYFRSNATNCTDSNSTENPDCWTGFCPDITAKMAKELNFSYKYVLNEDNRVGGYHEGINLFGWNGLIGDLVAGRIDLIAATLTINAERKQVIDFSSPIMTVKSDSIVSVRGQHVTKNKFFFLAPFDTMVWLFIILAGVITMLFLNIFSKLSPYGRYGSKLHALQTCPCEECNGRRNEVKVRKCSYLHTKGYDCHIQHVEDEDPLREISLYDSSWSISTGFVGQGPENVPRNITSRFLLWSWWLFMMVVVTLYTANLTAFLTLKHSGLSVNTVKDLLDQNEMKWGVIPDRITESRLQNHADGAYRQLLERSVKLKDLTEAITRVRESDFVFLDEDHVLEYQFKSDCDTANIPTGIQSSELAYGIKKNSPFENMINGFFLENREKAYFKTLRNKWYGGSNAQCGGGSLGNDTPIDLPSLEGMFTLLGLAIATACCLCLFEFIYAAWSDSGKEPGTSFCTAINRRLNLKVRDIKLEWLRIGSLSKSSDLCYLDAKGENDAYI